MNATDFSVSGTEKVPVAIAPGFGEHGREILLEAGYQEGEISELMRAGVVGGA